MDGIASDSAPHADSEMVAGEGPELSVVIACDGSASGLLAALTAIAASCTQLSAEIIVVHDSMTTVPHPSDLPLPIRLVAVNSPLVPVLWGHGIREARGRTVALTTTQFRVDAGWSRQLLHGLQQTGCSGIGGRMALDPSASMLSRALFLLRYSEHIGTAVDQPVREIAGDNAAYRRADIELVAPVLGSGFWEVDVHRLLRARGRCISRAPHAVALFASSLTLGAILANRFEHGSHYGRFRVHHLQWPRWKAVAVAPAVPVVLLWRILRRVHQARRLDARDVLCLPLMMLMLMAWAAGECRGALRSPSPSAGVSR